MGGETAEMPGFYPVDEYDLAGFSVGLVDEEKIIDGKSLAEGDVLIGLASSGVHSNGFSLVRKVFDVEHADLTTPMDELNGKSLGEALLEPTRIYVKAVKAVLGAGVDIHAVSHITGGGFYENVPRMMVDGLTAQIKLDSFPTLPIFSLIQKAGNIPARDIYNTFNMGIGMILAVPAAQAQAARAAANREQRLFNAKITARQDLEAAIAARQMAEAELQRADAAVRSAGVTGGGRYLAVRSPISGRITEVDTQLGAYVSAGSELFNVSDPRRIQIDAAVPVTDAQRIRPGDRALVELPNGGVVEAGVRSVTPSLDPQSRAATVVLQLSGAPGGLTQGQAVRVRVTPRGSLESGIILPEEAVQQIEGRDMVFIQVKGGFQAVPVSVGPRSGGRVEILDGIRSGQVVVTQGAFVLKSQLGASEAEH